MSPRLVLSLFPGLGLLDAAFEAVGFQVVRGPDLIFGGDVRKFHIPSGVFDGIIGGPPCQRYSAARNMNKGRPQAPPADLIGEYVRLLEEGQPNWWVMENVAGARHSPFIPKDWPPPVWLRDWDCGGLTNRRRLFWCSPFWMLSPAKRPGRPQYSVLASTGKRGNSARAMGKGLHGSQGTVDFFADLQGARHLIGELKKRHASKEFIVHLLGNGVPLAMGLYVAGQALQLTLGGGYNNENYADSKPAGTSLRRGGSDYANAPDPAGPSANL